MSGKYTETFKHLTTNQQTEHPARLGPRTPTSAGQTDTTFSSRGGRTGTINKVEKKLQRNSSRKGSDGRIFPSTLIVLGTSGMRLMAALKKASAARQESPSGKLKKHRLCFLRHRPEPVQRVPGRRLRGRDGRQARERVPRTDGGWAFPVEVPLMPPILPSSLTTSQRTSAKLALGY